MTSPPLQTPLFQTERTAVRELTAAHAGFIRELLNQETFLRFIGDRNVRTIDDAVTVTDTRYGQSYRDHGYGLYAVCDRATDEAMGLCGFVRRAELPAPDMGFAFLPAYEGRGIAFEAGAATLAYGREVLELERVLAIVSAENARSYRLLARLGFSSCGTVSLSGETSVLDLYARTL